MIEFNHVTKYYKNTKALDDISFLIENEKTTGIIGHNGAGKTTMFMVANGLTNIKQGEVRINDYILSKNKKKIQEATGLFTDRLHLYNILTVKECIMYFLKVNGRSTSNYKELADDFGFFEYEKKQIVDLSTGMQKRVLLAVSMINEPKVLFLDEPFTGLDPESRREFSKIVKKVQLQYGTQILIASHDLWELETLIDNLLLLQNGRLIVNSSLSELMKNYFPSTIISIELLFRNKNDLLSLQQEVKKSVGFQIDPIPNIEENIYKFHIDYSLFQQFMKIIPDGVHILSINDLQPSLDELYFIITNKQ